MTAVPLDEMVLIVAGEIQVSELKHISEDLTSGQCGVENTVFV